MTNREWWPSIQTYQGQPASLQLVLGTLKGCSGGGGTLKKRGGQVRMGEAPLRRKAPPGGSRNGDHGQVSQYHRHPVPRLDGTSNRDAGGPTTWPCLSCKEQRGEQWPRRGPPNMQILCNSKPHEWRSEVGSVMQAEIFQHEELAGEPFGSSFRPGSDRRAAGSPQADSEAVSRLLSP